MPAAIKIRLDVLDADLKKINKTFDKRSREIYLGAGRTLLSNLVELTRVDTGEAVSNWRVGLGQPTRAKVGPYSPGKKGSTAAQNRAGALAAGMTVIARAKPGQTLFIANHADHIVYLDGGSPTTPADNIVGRALAITEAWVDTQKALD